MTSVLISFDNKDIIKLDDDRRKAVDYIRKVRNEIAGHRLSPKLSIKELNTLWTNLTKVRLL